MEYDFRKIEEECHRKWSKEKIYKVFNPEPGKESEKPKYYVLDMFPYPSGAGLHVGHPLGYIASDIYSRYKRLKGFNVLHPMGFDSFGLPAEQYAIETGQHPATTTEKNIATFKAQLDKIGFCYDWDREVRTSNPKYYKWTQWIFLQLFNSYYCNTQKKSGPIADLIKKYETKGSKYFTAADWNAYTKKEQQGILMQRRLAFSAYGEVNWCEALGTVLANDEVVNGVSERGGHPVVKKKMRQWYLRITAYADRLLEGLETVNFSDAMKEMQRNWIGKSEGAELIFPVPSPKMEKGVAENDEEIEAKNASMIPKYKVSPPAQFELAKQNRKEHTEAEDLLWQELRNHKLEVKFRRQHPIDSFIVDFVSLQNSLIIEADGGYHENEEQKKYDENRTRILNEIGFSVLRFTNEEIINEIETVLSKIKSELQTSKNRNDKESKKTVEFSHPSPKGEGLGVRVYTTRPDTIFGVDFIVLAPEHDLVNEITSADQKEKIEEYLTYVKSRSDRERMAEVKQITGCFTGAYAINPFDGKQIPIWIAEYVLAGYGTGAIMAVPCGDQRDFAFAKHFNIPITNIIGNHYNGEEANPTKEATLENSDFLNGMLMKDAIAVAINKIEELGIGKRKVNYRMRDAGFSRQRYWGEPFPIKWEDGVAIALGENELPLELPHVEKYGPGPEGEGPLANIKDWVDLTPNPSPKERGTEPLSQPGFVTSTAEEWKHTIEFAKQNRKEPTAEEDIIWQELRNRQIDGYKFRRQHPIAGYIPDFVCLEKNLIIEIDGGYHTEEEQKIFDSAREKWLVEYGYVMLSFTNEAVKNDLKNVLEKITNKLSEIESNVQQSKSSSPLLGRGAGGEVKRETSTMPGYAGSSWYFLRYMDPHNDDAFCGRNASDYWNQVDVYIGGTEHAVGHLLYSRMWTKVLYDLGLIGFDEPFKKLVNQGMIGGVSEKFYRIGKNQIDETKSFSGFSSSGEIIKWVSKNNIPIFLSPDESDEMNFYLFNISADLNVESYETSLIRTPITNVKEGILDLEKYIQSKSEESKHYEIFLCRDGYYDTKQKKWFNYDKDPINPLEFRTHQVQEKMSKRYGNVVNPNDVASQYGADTFRMYEMFLGPVEQSKPWDTKGIEGVHRFLRKLWRLFYDELKGQVWTNEAPTNAELKVLHKTIKKIEYDTENFSFNTAVSAFMISVNELADLKCHKKEILEQLLILLVPYAPHIAEELWGKLGNEGSILNATYPTFDEKYLVEATKEYPVSINGKMRTTISMATDAEEATVKEMVLANDIVQKWLEGKEPKKIIFVKGKMVNVVL
jgi:leucyl-tRNA synthetase